MLLLLIFLFLISCRTTEERISGETIATINGDTLTEDMLVEIAGVSSIHELNEQQRYKKINNWIKITLLAQEADLIGVTQNTSCRVKLELAAKTIKANELLSFHLKDVRPSETDLFNYYQVHKGTYLEDREEYRIQRIFVTSEAKADSISQLIINNKITFGDAARKYSQEDASRTDGYIGFLSLQEMDDVTRSAVTRLSRWRYMKIKSDRGYQLIRYTEKRNRQVEKTFVDVIDEIEEEYIRERKNQQTQELLERLMNDAEIIITQ